MDRFYIHILQITKITILLLFSECEKVNHIYWGKLSVLRE